MAIDSQRDFIYVSNAVMGTVDEYTLNRTTNGVTYGSSVTVPLATPFSPGTVNLPHSQPTGQANISTSPRLAIWRPTASTRRSGRSYRPQRPTFRAASLQPSSRSHRQVPLLHGWRINRHLRLCDQPLQRRTLIPWWRPFPPARDQPISASPSTANTPIWPNGKDGTFSLYNDNPSTGLLTAMTPSIFTQGGGPFQIALDPGDQLAYVVLETAGINLLSINADGFKQHQRAPVKLLWRSTLHIAEDIPNATEMMHYRDRKLRISA